MAFNSVKASDADRGNSVSNDISKKPGVSLLLPTKYDLIRIACFIQSRGLPALSAHSLACTTKDVPGPW